MLGEVEADQPLGIRAQWTSRVKQLEQAPEEFGEQNSP